MCEEDKRYSNLNRCVHTYLVENILWPNYYNYGCDVESCDEIMCQDIKFEYDKKCREVKKYKILWLSTVGYLVLYVILNVVYFYK